VVAFSAEASLALLLFSVATYFPFDRTSCLWGSSFGLAQKVRRPTDGPSL